MKTNTINIGAQYYRPPFPDSMHWKQDLAEMKAAGLNTLQLWVVWAWVEPDPGKFVFDDYDRLLDIAENVGLRVVLSTIAAIHPYWIHREVPGSEMLTADGHVVVSTNRCEVHYGLTPGGSISHPGVWERMSQFLTAVVERYRSRPNLVGWDAWNELRWRVHSGGLVDYSDAAIAEFRTWLDHTYGGLDGLNQAWKRRYPCWDDVHPGRVPDRTYTEMMAFEHFLTWRSDEHARKRYALIKALDPKRPVTVHGAHPSILHGVDSYTGVEPATTLHRGNDWFLADHADGIGVSSFPAWQNAVGEGFSTRIDFMAAAAGDKLRWLSELQGGRSNVGFKMAPPVPAANQQRWLWEGISVGADSILFWCWRDEVFGRESAGFGLAGNDGMSEQRLDAMRHTAAVVKRHAKLLGTYKPAAPRVGIFFSPQAYYLYWAQDGRAAKPQNAICGYATALLRCQIPYTVIEECHLDRLRDLDILFMPRDIVIDDEADTALQTFVSSGGTLVVESETGAFGTNGLYRYPGQRHLAAWTGIQECGRRALTTANAANSAGEHIPITLELDGKTYELAANQWLTPMQQVENADSANIDIAENGLTAVAKHGKGRVIAIGSYIGDSYEAIRGTAAEHAGVFETLLEDIVDTASVTRPVTLEATTPESDTAVVIRTGSVEDNNDLLFVFAPPEIERIRIRLSATSAAGTMATDLLSDQAFAVNPDGSIDLQGATWGFYVLHVNT